MELFESSDGNAVCSHARHAKRTRGSGCLKTPVEQLVATICRCKRRTCFSQFASNIHEVECVRARFHELDDAAKERLISRVWNQVGWRHLEPAGQSSYIFKAYARNAGQFGFQVPSPYLPKCPRTHTKGIACRSAILQQSSTANCHRPCS